MLWIRDIFARVQHSVPSNLFLQPLSRCWCDMWRYVIFPLIFFKYCSDSSSSTKNIWLYNLLFEFYRILNLQFFWVIGGIWLNRIFFRNILKQSTDQELQTRQCCRLGDEKLTQLLWNDRSESGHNQIALRAANSCCCRSTSGNKFCKQELR